MNKQHKTVLGIIGVFLIVLMCGFFTFSNVQAEDTQNNEPMKESEVDPNKCTEDILLEKYNIAISETGVATDYKLSINPDSSDRELQNVTFVIKAINGVTTTPEQQAKYTITGKGNLVVYMGNINNFPDSPSGEAEKEAKLLLETFNDPDCGNVKINATITVGIPVPDTSSEEIYDPGTPSKQIAVDCTNYASKFNATSFEYNYCDARKKAIDLGHVYDLGKADSFETASIAIKDKLNNDNKLKCNYDPRPGTGETKDTYYLAKNRSYYYAYNEYDKTIEDAYVYNYAPGNVVKEDATCKVRCYESVVVEYGAPVASKAGFCFEYKVKVTSRVTCDSEAPTKFKKKSGYCTPTPVCTNRGAYYVTEAGPTQEFESCIEDCDGGKYTQKCSKKCYKKVYGKSSKNKNVATDNFNYYSNNIEMMASTTLQTQLDKCLERSKNYDSYRGGCYYKQDGKIKWAQTVPKTWNGAPGRWYPLKGYKNYRDYDVDSAGFYRHDYGSYHCRDTCWWTGCSGNKYLNPTQADADFEANKKQYEALKEECKAAASCTEKTAEFTIEVDYKTKDETITIEFPYQSEPDKLPSQSKEEGTVAGSTADKTNTTILDYNGCYKSYPAANWYQTEWSFPGSWMNSKTGEISFVDKTGQSGWFTEKDKFCVPLNAESVNAKWWNWYKNINATADDTFTSEEYIDDCGNVIKQATFSSDDAKDLEYNIRAQTQKFGYFGWKFNISCFYALNNNPSSASGEDNSSSDKCNTTLNYRVRSVDMDNMFPAQDGTATDTSSVAGATGRKPGFNWTQQATISYAKNEKYAVNPSELIAEIQSVGDDIYYKNDKKYLDYEFVLTPKTLQAIRNLSTDRSKENYTSWLGTFDVTGQKYGVVTYSSGLFRNGGILDDVSITKEKGNIGCNNDGTGENCELYYTYEK